MSLNVPSPRCFQRLLPVSFTPRAVTGTRGKGINYKSMEETNNIERIALLGDVFADMRDKSYSYEEIRSMLDEVYEQ